MNMRSFYIFCLSVCSLMLNACSKEYVSTASDNGKVQVSIGQSLKINTRTSIADDGTTAIWSGGDKIAVWAAASDGTYALEGEVFTMWHYNDALSSAIFTATITPMPEGVYTYYATYPEPKSVGGTTAVYELPQTQSAIRFNGACDIMVARPVENAGALTDAKVNEMNFSFSHKMHSLKVNIPRGGNMLGMPITRLEFTFPTNVTGDVEVDIADPLAPAVLTNGSNKLVLEIPEGADEGESVWGMIFPTDISGEITYTAYSGGYASFPRTITVAKSAEAAHITPMSLPIPELYRLTEISLSIGENNLGEDVQSVSILSENGNVIKTLPANAENEYILSYEGEIDAAQFSGKRFTARFESEHAIVEQPFTMPTITPYIKNIVEKPVDVPYLFSEDFSGIGDISHNDGYTSGSNSTKQSATSFLSGWTGARIGAQAGTSIRIAARRETSARYYGRADSAPLACIKAGASVKVEVTFDYGMGRQEGGFAISMPQLGQTCYLGSTTDGAAHDSDSNNGTFTDEIYIKEITGSYDYIPHTDGKFEIAAAQNNTRIVWRNRSESNAGLTNGTFWFYIDNVKVKIVK